MDDDAGRYCVAQVVLAADVSRADEIGPAVRTLADTFGPPAVFAHNAAVMPTGTLDQTSKEDWELE